MKKVLVELSATAGNINSRYIPVFWPRRASEAVTAEELPILEADPYCNQSSIESVIVVVLDLLSRHLEQKYNGGSLPAKHEIDSLGRMRRLEFSFHYNEPV
jgi:hypothetical protein